MSAFVLALLLAAQAPGGDVVQGPMSLSSGGSSGGVTVTTMSGVSVTCPSGVGTSALTLDPTCTVPNGLVIAPIVNSDVDGCNVTVAKTLATAGCQVFVYVASSAGGNVSFADVANTLTLNGSPYVIPLGQNLSFNYETNLATPRYQETGRNGAGTFLKLDGSNGPMTGPLQGAAGAIGAPGLTLVTAGTTTGWYATGAGQWRFSGTGTFALSLDNTTIATQIEVASAVTSGNVAFSTQSGARIQLAGSRQFWYDSGAGAFRTTVGIMPGSSGTGFIQTPGGSGQIDFFNSSNYLLTIASLSNGSDLTVGSIFNTSTRPNDNLAIYTQADNAGDYALTFGSSSGNTSEDLVSFGTALGTASPVRQLFIGGTGAVYNTKTAAGGNGLFFTAADASGEIALAVGTSATLAGATLATTIFQAGHSMTTASAGTALFSVLGNGHVKMVGIAAADAGTGTCTAVTVSGTDRSGKITATCTAGQTVIVNFGQTFAAAPICTVSGGGNASTTTTVMTVTELVAITGVTITYICEQNS